MDNFHIRPADVLSELSEGGWEFKRLFAHGSLAVEIYKPHLVDRQQPHDRDEVYIIVAGSGKFIRGIATVHCQAGDFLFVPAGMDHHFEDFTTDFATWVLFYGPEGGEAEEDQSGWEPSKWRRK